MQIEVKLFAQARELAGAECVSVSLSDGATVRDLKEALQTAHPELKQIVNSLLVAVNHDYANDEAIVTAHCDVACFPPVSGG